METATRPITEETTALKSFEITIPEKYVSPIRSLIKSMGGKIKARKIPKCGLDEALEDVRAGRVYEATSTEEMMKQIFGKDYPNI